MQARGNLAQLGLRRFDRGAGREPGVDVGHPVDALVLHRGAHVVIVGRVVDVEVLLALGRIMRAGSEDADDDRFLDRQVEDLADRGRIRAEDALPVAVRQHHDRRRGLLLVIGNQQAAPQRLHAEDLEEVRRHQPAGRAMRVAAAEHVEGPVAELDELVDGLRRGPVVGDFLEREAGVLDAGAHRRLAEVHDAVGLGVGQRPQQHPVDDAEDGGVGPDAEAERQDEGQDEARRLGQAPDRRAETHIVYPFWRECSALL